MEFHNNESSLHFDATHHNSVIESILLEPPTTAAPVQAPKPSSSYQVPDFEKVNFSLSSDASESDHVVFNNDLQNSRTRNHSPTSKYNKIASAPTFPCFHAKLPLGVRPNRKHDFEEIHEPGLNSFQKCTESSFNPHMNGIPSKSRVKNLVSPTAYHQLSNHSSKNFMLENNGELRPEFNRLNKINSPFFSGYQNVCSASSHFENSKTLTVPQCTVKGNLLNKSDSVTLLPQQLQFHESHDAMNDYLNTNISNSEYVPEKGSSPLHAMKMHKKFREHRSLDDVENMSIRPKLQQESHPIDSDISPFYDLSRCDTNAKISVPYDIWALFREQNEKIEQLQNQLLTVLKQNNSVAVSKQETTLELSEDKKFERIDKNINTLLKNLTEHNNTILTLSDQVSVLAIRRDELESKSKTNVSKPLDFSNTGATSSAEASNRHNSNDDVMCHNETDVKKTSRSTMTSVTLDGNEKCMFCKTNAVTENCKRELLLQHLQNENPPAENFKLNKAQSSSKEVALNLCTNCTTPKSLNLKKTEKNNKNSDNVTRLSDWDSHETSTVRIRSSKEKISSSQCDYSRANTNANGRQHSSENSSSNFDRISRNIENLSLGKSEDEKTSSKHCDSCCSDMSKSSGTCKKKVKRKSKSYKKSLACAYSSTSEDFVYARPNSGWTYTKAYTNEWYETTRKKYGISPSLLSEDTQEYLDKHCLHVNIEKQSSKKSTAPHHIRQIR